LEDHRLLSDLLFAGVVELLALAQQHVGGAVLQYHLERTGQHSQETGLRLRAAVMKLPVRLSDRAHAQPTS
jgi:hypothetical protein